MLDELTEYIVDKEKSEVSDLYEYDELIEELAQLEEFDVAEPGAHDALIAKLEVVACIASPAKTAKSTPKA
jgi:hypothetical protein